MFPPRRISLGLGLEIVTGRTEVLRSAGEKAKALATILDNVGRSSTSENSFTFNFKVQDNVEDFLDRIHGLKKLRRFLSKQLEQKKERIVMRGVFGAFPGSQFPVKVTSRFEMRMTPVPF